MKNILIAVLVLALTAVGYILVFKKTPLEPQQIACTEEAKICPDGSAVGRQGPRCEFATCPSTSASITPGVVTTKLGQKITIQDVSITPLEVVNDSRCPLDVVCIQAGTVNLRIQLEYNGKTQTTMLAIGNSVLFGGKHISLVSVIPTIPTKIGITLDEYAFEFSVVK